MVRIKLILAASTLLAATGAFAQSNGVPDNDWLMKTPVPSGQSRSAKQEPGSTSTETGAAASASSRSRVAPPAVGSLDSSYGRP
ncbi:MAG TPA: hypothetical protein VH105_03210 [Burkholderiales bacterium]|nr:hypothetical protein [Burkholderiales bacterium]